MFGLIPLVATIILAVIVGGAIAYYGGDIFSDGSIGAEASTYINEGGQIRSTSQLYRLNQGEWPQTGVSDLTGATPSYLSNSPSKTYVIDGTSGKVTALDSGANNASLTQAVCDEIQDAAGGTVPAPAAEPANQLFGCWDNATVLTFFHR